MPSLQLPTVDDKIVLYAIKRGSEPTNEDVEQMMRSVFPDEVLSQFPNLNTGFLIQRFNLNQLVAAANKMPGLASSGQAQLAALIKQDPWNAAVVAATVHFQVVLKDPAKVGAAVAASWRAKVEDGKAYYLQPLHQDDDMCLLALCEHTAPVPGSQASDNPAKTRRATGTDTPIRVRCENPTCGKVLKVKGHLAGKRIKCPGCGQSMKVPDQRQVPDDEQEPLQKPRKRGPKKLLVLTSVAVGTAVIVGVVVLWTLFGRAAARAHNAVEPFVDAEYELHMAAEKAIAEGNVNKTEILLRAIRFVQRQGIVAAALAIGSGNANSLDDSQVESVSQARERAIATLNQRLQSQGFKRDIKTSVSRDDIRSLIENSRGSLTDDQWDQEDIMVKTSLPEAVYQRVYAAQKKYNLWGYFIRGARARPDQPPKLNPPSVPPKG
jgi:hypothetical protein